MPVSGPQCQGSGVITRSWGHAQDCVSPRSENKPRKDFGETCCMLGNLDRSLSLHEQALLHDLENNRIIWTITEIVVEPGCSSTDQRE